MYASDIAPRCAENPLLLDYRRAAAMLCLSPAALRDLVYRGAGPVPTRLGRRTMFAVSDLITFVEAHREVRIRPPSGAGPNGKRGRPTIAGIMERTNETESW
jgi:hypothetical protein